jgi:hypothetical protein
MATVDRRPTFHDTSHRIKWPELKVPPIMTMEFEAFTELGRQLFKEDVRNESL